MTRAVAVRAALGVVAAIACAWFVVGIHNNDDLVNASHIAAQAHPSARAAARARALLASAATLNPDRTVTITRAQLALARGDAPGARRILRGVVAAEPDNFDAWKELVLASSGDPHERAIAFAHALALTNTKLPGR